MKSLFVWDKIQGPKIFDNISSGMGNRIRIGIIFMRIFNNKIMVVRIAGTVKM